jgi:transposase
VAVIGDFGQNSSGIRSSNAVQFQEPSPVRLASLLPHFAGLRLRHVVLADKRLTFDVAPSRRGAPGPLCRQKSIQRHSQYTRTLVDLPWGGRPVRIRLQVRRFRCRNRACPRRVVAERFPNLAAVKARRTWAQGDALADYGFAVGGAPGARLAHDQGLEGSRRTILRAVHATPLPTFPTPRVRGVDDWARRKGQTYGTILVDLERRRVVDLLEDRTVASLARWLRELQGVEAIARDRAGAYADGARHGAPDVSQVAERFHLLVNVGEALERVLARKHTR